MNAASSASGPDPDGARPIRLLLADDQAMIRNALATLLDLEDDLSVVAQVGAGTDVLPAVLEHRPDICLLDIEMPGIDGIEACRLVRKAVPDARVLMVTTFGRPGYLRRAMDVGASGFLVKDTPADELVAACRRVHAGNTVIDPGLAADTLVFGPNPLTQRETEILRIALDGATVAVIAGRLHLSAGTVRNHLSAAIGKTGATTRVEAARLAQTRGWL